MSDEVTTKSLSKFYNTIDAAKLRGGDLITENRGTNGGGLTITKADEKYKTEMSIMEDLCVTDIPRDLMLM